MSGPDWQEIAKELGTSDKERLAIWMIQHGFATGHGDTLDDLLHEMSWQIAELRMDVGKKNRLITEVADALEAKTSCVEYWDIALIERAREATKEMSTGRYPEAFEGDWYIEAELRRLVEKWKVRTIVETGTYKGQSTRALAGMGAEVITIEIEPEPELVEIMDLANVRALTGDSAEFLDEAIVLMRVSQPILFYLDAHWREHSPLLDELGAIARLCLREKPLLAIHDFLNPQHPEYGCDTWDIGLYCLALIRTHLDMIYGEGCWVEHYNDGAAGLKRGIIYVEPKE